MSKSTHPSQDEPVTPTQGRPPPPSNMPAQDKQRSLPIDDVLDDIARALERARRAVVEAPPGAGKTTRVAPFLADRQLQGQRDVVVVEPRRLAARLAARHVATKRGEHVGDFIGYQVRFDSAVGPRTRVRYVTDGVFVRQLLSAPSLPDVGIVIIDEFHERHLLGDVTLSWLVELQRTTRPDLGLVVMSATLDADHIASFLDCPVVKAHGRRFEVDVAFCNEPDDRPLERKVASAVRSLASGPPGGDVLVFLPGMAEIRKAHESCTKVASDLGLELVSLHGNLPSEEQDRALSPRPRPKVILSTNVAESSVTIGGVVAVVDSGLARIAGHAPWSGLPTLRVAPVSKASIAQRTGRAGRERPGRCVRLFSEADWRRRPEHERPEIHRADLTEAALLLRGLGVREPAALPWLEPPAPNAWQAADDLLAQLGALAPAGGLTNVGQKLLRFPVHPRVGRILVEGQARGVPREAATIAALMGERDLARARRPATPAGSSQHEPPPATDVLDALALFEEASAARFAPGPLHAMGVDVQAARDVDRARKQLLGLCRDMGRRGRGGDEQLRMCVLSGYPDRVARRVRDREVTLVGGGSAWVMGTDRERIPEFLVAIDAEERRQGRQRRMLVRSLCAIEAEALLDMFPDSIAETREHRFDPARGCVESVERLLYRSLVLDETRGKSADSDAVSALLAREAIAAGVHALVPKDALESLAGRIAFVRELEPEAGLPALDAAALENAIRRLCVGLRCLSELRDANLIQALRDAMTSAQRRQLESLAPEQVQLPGGRRLTIHYEPGKPPWTASRLQDFFGMADGPRVGNGKVPVVLHLLAPNRRAVQVTSDLAGFWQKHYPALRKQLCRRYPKHAWPDDGRTARPPAPGKLR
ncbi:MAG: ATP-dependent helicase HrpB [Myxococcota bacterium]